MNKTYFDIVFEGKNFLPGKLKELSGFELEILAGYGKIAGKGRYKGQKSPYGLALLKVSGVASEDLNKVLKKTIAQLLQHKELIQRSGVEEITLDLENFSKSEVGITIDKELIKKISELNA